MTPLSYSLAAFQPGGYSAVEPRLQDLKDLGFEWVTLTPTYLVYDETPMRIDVARGPSHGELKSAVDAARAKGLRVQLDPHLDFETTLTGGPYEWRRRMNFSPQGAYLNEILHPLAGMSPDALTLGSELDVSLAAYPEDWTDVRQHIQEASIGHKLNHDSLDSGASAIRKLVDIGRWEYRKRIREIHHYLSTLDYVSFSFYPSGGLVETARRIRDRLKQPDKFAIGEFGLGSADLSRPWHFDASTFDSPDALQKRREYYLNFLQALTENADLFGTHPASFWTVGHFDFLDGNYRDDALREAVRSYNATSQQPPRTIE